MTNKIYHYMSKDDIVTIIKNKKKKLERDLKDNYKPEDHYKDIQSKIDILNEILNEIGSD